MNHGKYWEWYTAENTHSSLNNNKDNYTKITLYCLESWSNKHVQP